MKTASLAFHITAGFHERGFVAAMVIDSATESEGYNTGY